MSDPAAAPQRWLASEWRMLYAAVTLVAVGLLLFRLAPSLSPVVLYALVLLLLAPWSGSRQHLLLVGALTLALVLWLLQALGSILAPFVVAFAIAYILDPAADALERRRVPRGVAVAILLVPVLSGIALALVFGVPALLAQAGELVGQLPGALTRAADWVQAQRVRLEQLRLPFVSGAAVAEQLPLDEARITAFIQAQWQDILGRAWHAVLGMGRGVGFVVTLIGYLVLTPVLVVYLLRDFNRITARLTELVPAARRDRWLGLAREYDTLLARFLRGQVLAALIVGVLTWVGLLIVGFPYSGLVGAIAGVFNLVPYLGLVVSIVPVLVIAILSGSFLAALAKAAIVFFVVQLIDGSVTGPRIVGGSVGLHPVWVILALAIGSFFFGMVGLLLAVPGAVLVKLLLREALARYASRPPAPGTTP